MKLLLAPEGVITLEFPHLQRLIAENQFDTIYHERFSYFSLVTVDQLAESHGLKVIDVEKLETHGGSLRVYLAHAASARRPSPRVSELLEHEIESGFLEIETYARFAEQVRRTKRNLLSFLIAAKEQGKRICGYGAPPKGNTLLNYCGIGTDFLDFIVDRNPYQHGRFTPGMHVPVRPVEAIDEARPDYLLILPWNAKDEITRRMRHIGDWGGRFVIPIPEVARHRAEPERALKVGRLRCATGSRPSQCPRLTMPQAPQPEPGGAQGNRQRHGRGAREHPASRGCRSRPTRRTSSRRADCRGTRRLR